MLLINGMNVTISDLVKDNNINNLLVFILFGLDKPDLKRALSIVEGWVELFGEYKSLKVLVLMDLKNKFGFIKENDSSDDIESIFDKKEDTENKELTHDEIVKIEKDNLNYVIKVYMKSGYSYEQAIEMDMSNFEFFNTYVIEQREQMLNDLQTLLHKASAWITIGSNNPKHFPQEVESIRLRQLTRDEKIEQIRKDTKAFYNEMSKEEVDNG